MAKKQFIIKIGVLCILLYYIAINICFADGSNRKVQNGSQPEYWKCSFSKPTLAVSTDETEKDYKKTFKNIEEALSELNLKSQTLIAEEEAKKRFIKPVDAGWVEVKKEAPQKNQNITGVRQLISVIGRLLNGIGNAPIIPFTMASNNNFDWGAVLR